MSAEHKKLRVEGVVWRAFRRALSVAGVGGVHPARTGSGRNMKRCRSASAKKATGWWVPVRKKMLPEVFEERRARGDERRSDG